MDKISRAISSIESGRLFSYKDEDLDSIVWHDLDTKSPISKEDIQVAIDGLDVKANAKAKLIAGEPLTEAEADTIVLT